MSGLIPVLMCGGAGTRLWPVSRESMPKQFVPLVGERSTFQQTLQRVSDPDVRKADRDHAFGFPFRRGGAVARDRHCGRHRAGTRTAQFRSCCCCCCCTGSTARSRRHRPHPRRGPCGAGSGGVPRGMSHSSNSSSSGAHRDLRHPPLRPRHQLRLHPPRREAQWRRGAGGRRVRGEAGRRNRGALCGGQLPVEQRQLHVPRRRDVGRDRPLRARHGGSRARRDHRNEAGPRFPAPCGRAVRPRAAQVDRLRGDGANQACCRGAGRHGLVRCRKLGRRVG